MGYRQTFTHSVPASADNGSAAQQRRRRRPAAPNAPRRWAFLLICLAATVSVAIYITDEPIPPAVPSSPAIHLHHPDLSSTGNDQQDIAVTVAPAESHALPLQPAPVHPRLPLVLPVPAGPAAAPAVAPPAAPRMTAAARRPAPVLHGNRAVAPVVRAAPGWPVAVARHRNPSVHRPTARHSIPAVASAWAPVPHSIDRAAVPVRWPLTGRSLWPVSWRLPVKGPGWRALQPAMDRPAAEPHRLPLVLAPPVVSDPLAISHVPSLSTLFHELSRHRSLPLPPIAGLPSLPTSPSQPSLPFIYLGKLVIGGQTMFFLSDGRRVYLAKPGDHIGKQWAFDRARGNQLTFIYLPGHARVQLPIPRGG